MYGYGVRAYDMDVAVLVGDRAATLLDLLDDFTFSGYGEVINGIVYIRFSYLQIAEDYFPIWSVRTIKRALDELVKQKLVFKKPGEGMDRRCSFGVNYAHEFLVNNKRYNNEEAVKKRGGVALCRPSSESRGHYEQESI